MDVSKQPNIIVIGDIMLDHNFIVKSQKIANEAPILVFNETSETFLLGGAGNVLHNLHNLGCGKLFMFGVRGNDENGSIIEKLISDLSVKSYLTIQEIRPTTVKTRYFCDNKIIFRCDKESSLPINVSIFSILSQIEDIIKKDGIDAIVLSDYDKGFLSADLCNEVIKLANKYSIFTCVDPKVNLLKYANCSLIKPNLAEAHRLTSLPASTDLLDVHKKLHEVVNCRFSVITLAEKGISLFDGKEMICAKTNVHSIIDVTGAGDIVCSILAYFFAKNTLPEKAIRIATHVASKSVEQPGSYKITPHDLQIGKIVHRSNAASLRNGRKNIVFTNGCFDILHPGHIELFRFCKSKGECVVVGLNSDSSITRLKGPSRPINNEASRIAMLEAQEFIDYIIVFDENTPYELLKDLKPDILVKGGDYKITDIIGREFAGETLICDFLKGFSTTSIVQKLSAPKRKTVIHVWKQRFANCKMTNDSFFWGLGDILRGVFGLYCLSKKIGFDLIVDTSHHPIGKFLKQEPHKYSQFIKENIDNVNLVWPDDVESYLTTNLKTQDVLYFYTNMGLNAFNVPFTADAKEFLKRILTPSVEFEELFKKIYASLPWHDYTLIHFRLGDDEIVRGKPAFDMRKVGRFFWNNTDLHTILISDSSSLKNHIRGKSKDVYLFEGPIAHCGYSDDLNALQNTLFEFFLAMKAKKIKTFSRYEWISGFVFIISKIFDIPLEAKLQLTFDAPSEQIIIGQPWGGLGDNLQFTSLPKLYNDFDFDVYISSQNIVRNKEIYDLVWGMNPYIKGILDKPPNAGACKGLKYPTSNPMKNMELMHGFTSGVAKYPIIYYKPKLLHELANVLLFDSSAVSTLLDKDILKKEFTKIFDLYPELTKKQISFSNLKTDLLDIANDGEYIVNSIYEYCDVLFSCKVFLASLSGASTLASAIKQDSPNPEIFIIHNQSHHVKGDGLMYFFDNANYICVN